MTRDKCNKRFLFLLLIIFTISFFSNIKSSKALWQQETIEPDSAIVYNIPSCTTGMTIDIQYNVISGPGGVDAYLVIGLHSGLLITKPSVYEIYEDNSISDNWDYEVPSDNDYSVQFFNDHNENIVLRFNIQTSRSRAFMILYISLGIAGPVITAVIVLILLMRRKKRKVIKSIEPPESEISA